MDRDHISEKDVEAFHWVNYALWDKNYVSSELPGYVKRVRDYVADMIVDLEEIKAKKYRTFVTPLRILERASHYFVDRPVTKKDVDYINGNLENVLNELEYFEENHEAFFSNGRSSELYNFISDVNLVIDEIGDERIARKQKMAEFLDGFVDDDDL